MTGLPTVTTSERYALSRCPQMWWWRYRMGLTPKGESPDALWFGIGVHIALAEYYMPGKKRGPHPAETFASWCGDEIREIRSGFVDRDAEWFDEPEYEDALTLGVDMLEHYIDTYGKDPRWTVVATEHPFRIRVNDGGKGIAYFNSTFDLVARDEDDGRLYLWDHKTAAQIQLPYLELDPQAGAYWAVATQIGRAEGWLGPAEEIAGINYNILRKSMRDIRPTDDAGMSLNKDGTVSKRQPIAAFHREMVERSRGELATEMISLTDEVRWMNAMRSGEMPVIKHRIKDCTWCEFFAMCKLHQRGDDKWKDFRDSKFLVADPYARYGVKSTAG